MKPTIYKLSSKKRMNSVSGDDVFDFLSNKTTPKRNEKGENSTGKFNKSLTKKKTTEEKYDKIGQSIESRLMNGSLTSII